MPDNKEVATARSRRAKREAADNKKIARSNAAARLEAEQNAAAAQAKADKAAGKPAETGAAAVKRISRAEQRKAEQAAAAEQAKRDAALKPEPVADSYRPGDPIPLHVLNQRRLQARDEVKDEALQIGRKVGQFTREVLTGREHIGNRGGRHRRMAEADAKMAQARAAAPKAEETT